MYWVMLSERSHERELSVDGTPPLVEQHDWQFDSGVAQPGPLPVIDVPVKLDARTRMVDNVPAYGCRGLLVNARVKGVFDGLGLDNLEYHAARLVDARSGPLPSPYWIANVIGTRACVQRSSARAVSGACSADRAAARSTARAARCSRARPSRCRAWR